jgi:hypothetical protein
VADPRPESARPGEAAQALIVPCNPHFAAAHDAAGWTVGLVVARCLVLTGRDPHWTEPPSVDIVAPERLPQIVDRVDPAACGAYQ